MLKYAENFVKVTKTNDVLHAVASDASVDRSGERIFPSAFEKWLPVFLKNPVMVAAHLNRSMNGEPTTIGSAPSMRIKENKLVFEPSFSSIPLAQLWKTLYDEGHQKAFSVGFLPHEGDMIDEIWTWTEVELVHISPVPVGSNRNALIQNMVDGDVEKMTEMLKQNKHSKQLSAILEQLQERRLMEAVNALIK